MSLLIHSQLPHFPTPSFLWSLASGSLRVSTHYYPKRLIDKIDGDVVGQVLRVNFDMAGGGTRI